MLKFNNRIFVWHCIGIFVALPCFLYAQQYNYLNYNVENGLAGSTVYTTFQDNDGFMWFGTETGLSRFDGTHFKNYTNMDGLPDNEVFKIIEDNKGRKWIKTYKQLPCYIENNMIHSELNDSVFKNLIPLKKNIAVASEVIYNTYTKNIYIEIANQLFSFENNRFIKILNQADSSHGVALFNYKNNTYVLAHDSLFVINNAKLNYLPLDASLLLKAKYADRGDYLYCVSKNEVRKLKLEYNKFVCYAKREFKNSITSIAINNKDEILIPTEGDGFYLLNEKFETKAHLDKIKNISSCSFDDEGNIWFSTLGSGIGKLKSIKNIFINSTNGLSSDEVYSLTNYGANKYIVGLGNGNLVKLVNGICTNININESPNVRYNRILKILYLKNNFYIASDYGFYKCNESFTNFEKIGKIGACKNLFFDSLTNRLYVCNSNDLFCYLHKTSELVPLKIGMRSSTVAIVNNHIMLIGNLNGLYELNIKNNEIKFLGDSFPQLRIRINKIVANNKGVYYLATHGNGLIYFEPAKKIIKIINTKNSNLSSNICKNIFIDSKHNVWICTNVGLNKLLQTQHGFRFIHYSIANGLPDNDVTDVDVSNEMILAATAKGLAFIENTGIEKYHNFKIKLLGIKINNNDTTLLPNLVLTHKQNNITLNYVGIDYKSDGLIEYEYQILPNKEWIKTSNSFLNLNTLDVGTYTITIKATNKVGHATSNNIKLIVQILPPWHKSIRFYILLGISVALLLASMIIYYIKRIRRKEQQKTEINKQFAQLELHALGAQMNPHFIFNALSSIQNFYAQNDEITANKYMVSFSKLIRQILDSSRKSNIRLSDEINIIENYLQLEKMRFKEKFDFEINVPQNLLAEEIYIPTMLIQPYAENAINHGLRPLTNRKGLLSINIIKHDDQLQISIVDNGIGIEFQVPKVTNHESIGMNVTQNRIELINKFHKSSINFSVQDRKNCNPAAEGTVVTIEIPLKLTTNR
jgi:hypothetical protein